MTTFDHREKAFEDKYAHDQELQFKVTARRNKLLGLWAAKQLGKSAADAETYAKEVVMADFEAPGDEDVFAKVLGDLQAAGIATQPDELRTHMQNLLIDAKQQIFTEGA
jgi:hypothetical protein